MAPVKISSGEWVVVCDGCKALILENRGDEKFPNLRMIEVREQKDLPTHDQGTDAPGRLHPSIGTSRSSVEGTDWHRSAEQAFVEHLAHHLSEALTQGRLKSLIVVAPPPALGMLRKASTASLRQAISAEVAKDLVKMPIDEIERHLSH